MLPKLAIIPQRLWLCLLIKAVFQRTHQHKTIGTLHSRQYNNQMNSQNVKQQPLVEQLHALPENYRPTVRVVSVVEWLASTKSLCNVPAPVVFKNL